MKKKQENKIQLNKFEVVVCGFLFGLFFRFGENFFDIISGVLAAIYSFIRSF